MRFIVGVNRYSAGTVLGSSKSCDLRVVLENVRRGIKLHVPHRRRHGGFVAVNDVNNPRTINRSGCARVIASTVRCSSVVHFVPRGTSVSGFPDFYESSGANNYVEYLIDCATRRSDRRAISVLDKNSISAVGDLDAHLLHALLVLFDGDEVCT